MSLWAWAGQVWERPGRAEAWTSLQDDAGQCVPLLLWAVWLGARGRTPDADAGETAVLVCRESMTRIEPLRAARRAATSADRGELLRQELDAERALMDRLETIVVSTAKTFVASAETLSAISARWGAPVDPATFLGLVAEPADVG